MILFRLCCFFFNDTATTEIYTLSLHDALPISQIVLGLRDVLDDPISTRCEWHALDADAIVPRTYDQVWIYGDPRVFDPVTDRKSTRLNSSHANISYAVFCLKKKKTYNHDITIQ